MYRSRSAIYRVGSRIREKLLEALMSGEFAVAAAGICSQISSLNENYRGEYKNRIFVEIKFRCENKVKVYKIIKQIAE